MPRLYTVPFGTTSPGVAVTLPQDLFQIIGVPGKVLKLMRVRVTVADTTAPTSQMLQWRMSFLSGTIVNGSGGATATIGKTDNGDATPSFTALTNNTTKATGTAMIFYSASDHVFNGLDENNDGTLSKAPPLVATVAAPVSMVIELLSTVTGTVHMSGTAWVQEEG